MKIRCLKYNNIIEFLNRHDCKKCKCGACFIDGGNEYTRVGVNLNLFIVYINETEKELNMPKQ